MKPVIVLHLLQDQRCQLCGAIGYVDRRFLLCPTHEIARLQELHRQRRHAHQVAIAIRLVFLKRTPIRDLIGSLLS